MIRIDLSGNALQAPESTVLAKLIRAQLIDGKQVKLRKGSLYILQDGANTYEITLSHSILAARYSSIQDRRESTKFLVIGDKLGQGSEGTLKSSVCEIVIGPDAQTYDDACLSVEDEWTAEFLAPKEYAIKKQTVTKEKSKFLTQLERNLFDQVHGAAELVERTHLSGDEKLYMVTDKFGDYNLRELCKAISDGKISISQKHLLLIALNIVRAVKELHEQHQLLHLDIKPENIRVDFKTGQVWLIDFGFTLPFAAIEEGYSDISGTPRYMAPELWERQLSTKADLYALALTLLDMLSPETWSDDFIVDIHRNLPNEAQRERCYTRVAENVDDAVRTIGEIAGLRESGLSQCLAGMAVQDVSRRSDDLTALEGELEKLVSDYSLQVDDADDVVEAERFDDLDRVQRASKEEGDTEAISFTNLTAATVTEYIYLPQIIKVLNLLHSQPEYTELKREFDSLCQGYLQSPEVTAVIPRSLQEKLVAGFSEAIKKLGIAKARELYQLNDTHCLNPLFSQAVYATPPRELVLRSKIADILTYCPQEKRQEMDGEVYKVVQEEIPLMYFAQLNLYSPELYDEHGKLIELEEPITLGHWPSASLGTPTPALIPESPRSLAAKAAANSFLSNFVPYTLSEDARIDSDRLQTVIASFETPRFRERYVQRYTPTYTPRNIKEYSQQMSQGMADTFILDIQSKKLPEIQAEYDAGANPILRKVLRKTAFENFHTVYSSQVKQTSEGCDEESAKSLLTSLQDLIIDKYWKVHGLFSGETVDILGADEKVIKSITIPSHMKEILKIIESAKNKSCTWVNALKSVGEIANAQQTPKHGSLFHKTTFAMRTMTRDKDVQEVYDYLAAPAA